MTRRKRGSGVTLIELMVAMSIFSVLGLFLFMLMRNSLDIYRSSRSSGEVYDKLDQATSALVDDLSCVYIGDPEGSGPKVRFLATRDRVYVPPKEVELTAKAKASHEHAPGDPRSLLLRFVRTFPGSELETTIGRYAGTYADGSAYVDGVNDEEESRVDHYLKRGRTGQREDEPRDDPGPGLKAPANLMEVMYFLEQGEHDLPGTFTLYRAVRSPIGGRGSFFDDDTLKAMTPEWIAAYARPVVSGIAYFGIVFWSQKTERWDTEAVLSGEVAKDGPSAELWWDSTRGRHASFGLHRGAASLSRWEDDVFPSRARILVTFVQEGQDAPDAVLAGTVPGSHRSVRISNPGLFDDLDAGGPSFLRIDDEWMRVESVLGRELRVTRGVRQTAPSRHDSGAPVLVGRTFERTIEIPAHRSYFRGPGEGR